MFDSLADRQKDYEKSYDVTLTKRLPVVIRVDGRCFSRVTRKLERPFNMDLLKVMAQAMHFAISEMQGAVIGYQQSDEITFILRNDQSFDAEPWYQNRLQKMASIAASLVTYGFNKFAKEVNLDLTGMAIFDARVFLLPYFNEVANNLIWRQQDCTKNAISAAAQAELSKKFGKKYALKILNKKNSGAKCDLLLQHCGIDFHEAYPACFRRGVVAAKVPTIVPVREGTVTRNKWMLNWETPSFLEDKDFLLNILVNGHDVFKPDSLLEKHE